MTFIGDHGYQLGEKGEWAKSNLFELATRIPMYAICAFIATLPVGNGLGTCFIQVRARAALAW